MASDKYAQPERRPAVVTGASSGIGAATALRLGQAGFPVALGARRIDKLEEVAAQIRADGGEAVAHPLDLTDDDSVAAFAKAVQQDLGDIEVVVCNAGAVAPGHDHRGRLRAVHPRARPHRGRRAPAGPRVRARRWWSGAAATSSSSPPTPRSARGRSWRRTPRASGGSRAWSPALQMELEGTGVRASIVRPGPTWSEMGSDWDPDEAAFVLNQWVRFGLARHPHFLKPAAIADAITTIVSAPRGVHLNLVEVNPEAPVEDAMIDIREVSYAVPDDGYGHLAEMRVDPIGLFHRVREECGDIGRFRLADQDVVMVSRRRGQRAVLPGAGLDARPGGGVPVHDADLRQGRRLRRLARGAPADAEEPGAARRHDARPRADHRGRDQPDGRRVGRRGRDRPARLVRRADHLHDLGAA